MRGTTAGPETLVYNYVATGRSGEGKKYTLAWDQAEKTFVLSSTTSKNGQVQNSECKPVDKFSLEAMGTALKSREPLVWAWPWGDVTVTAHLKFNEVHDCLYACLCMPVCLSIICTHRCDCMSVYVCVCAKASLLWVSEWYFMIHVVLGEFYIK